MEISDWFNGGGTYRYVCGILDVTRMQIDDDDDVAHHARTKNGH